jgi:protein-S-isoprenylcysteine O-methyltransferase Ste14
MTLLLAKVIWYLGVIGWFVIRLPHSRRSRRTPIASRTDRVRDTVLLIISFSGMCLVPLTYVVTNEPKFATYPFRPAQAWLGTLVFAVSLFLFYLVHKQLGKNWSVTLEIREQHALVTSGLYQYVRHPMYTAFWLWAIAQALLLPNWVAGPAGLVGFGTLYFLRIGHEERMMVERFGDEYRAYAARTKRLIPGVY